MIRALAAFSIGFGLTLTGYATPAVASPTSHESEQEIMRVERNWCNAVLKNDAAALSEILSDDLTDVSYAGKLGSKAQDLADVKTEKTTVCEADQMQVRIFGDAAVVVGRDTLKSTAFTGQARFTDTWVRRNGRWKCVSTQLTEIKP